VRKALIIAAKDWKEARSNWQLMVSMLALPMTLVVAPVLVMTFAPGKVPEHEVAELLKFLKLEGADWTGPQLFAAIFARSWLSIFLLLPAFVPIMLAASSVVGEKERRTLEPLLAAPVDESDIVMGKAIAACIPGLIITWGAWLVFTVAIDAAAWRHFGRPILPDTVWVVGMVLIAPLLALLGNGFVVLVSSRVNDARVAQNIAGLITLPIMGILAAQVVARSVFGMRAYLSIAAVIAVADAAVYFVAFRLFDRDRILTRWS
jgi:ABC-type Na+ efflux pump permease subunit